MTIESYLVFCPAKAPFSNSMFKLFLYMGALVIVIAVEPHLVLCEDRVQLNGVFFATQLASFSVMDPIPYFSMVSMGT